MDGLYGRQVIYSNVKDITKENVYEVIKDAMVVHAKNRGQIQYLYDYYKGKQPILERVKEIRPEICNKIVENRANEIVTFKVGYLCGDPIQYISRSTEKVDSIMTLNDFMSYESKSSKDKDLIEWMMICGTGYRIATQSTEEDNVFEINTLDPRNTFVIYSTEIGNKPIAGVYYILYSNGDVVYNIYTRDRFFEILYGTKDKNEFYEIRREEYYPFKNIPIVEYPANSARLGSFEKVISLLDAINMIDSNRLDGIEQFIQSLLVVYNATFEEGTTANTIRQSGMVYLKSNGDNKSDIKVISEQLNQSETQTLKDDLYNTVLTICNMPNRNGGSSTSDTGTAVIYRDGWSSAESEAKSTEMMFKRSENDLLKVVLTICRDITGMDLNIYDIDIKFTRRLYDNASTKASILTTLLSNDKISPRVGFDVCGLFSDPESVYKESMEYYESNKPDEKEEIVVDENITE